MVFSNAQSFSGRFLRIAPHQGQAVVARLFSYGHHNPDDYAPKVSEPYIPSHLSKKELSNSHIHKMRTVVELRKQRESQFVPAMAFLNAQFFYGWQAQTLVVLDDGFTQIQHQDQELPSCLKDLEHAKQSIPVQQIHVQQNYLPYKNHEQAMRNVLPETFQTRISMISATTMNMLQSPVAPSPHVQTLHGALTTIAQQQTCPIESDYTLDQALLISTAGDHPLTNTETGASSSLDIKKAAAKTVVDDREQRESQSIPTITSSTVGSSSDVPRINQQQDHTVVASSSSDGHHDFSDSSFCHSIPQSLSPIPISKPVQFVKASLKGSHHQDQNCVNCRSMQEDAMRLMEDTNIDLQSVYGNLRTCEKDCKPCATAGLRRCLYDKCIHKVETTSSCAAPGMSPNLFNKSKDFTISGGTFNATKGDMHLETNTNQSRTCYINCVFKNHHSNNITPDDEVNPTDSTKETSYGATTEPCQPWMVKSGHKPNRKRRWT
ncbi:hypothetical protein FB446DRAFT_796958, partial [Lentinula raphanica]